MNSKHQKILEAIFSDPISGAIEWRKIEALFIAVGCQLIEGNGLCCTNQIYAEAPQTPKVFKL